VMDGQAEDADRLVEHAAMLGGEADGRGHARPRRERMDDRSLLHGLGPCADDDEDLQRGSSRRS